MKTEKLTTILSEKGIKLSTPSDGIIVDGKIFESSLNENDEPENILIDASNESKAYSKFELFQIMKVTMQDLEQYAMFLNEKGNKQEQPQAKIIPPKHVRENVDLPPNSIPDTARHPSASQEPTFNPHQPYAPHLQKHPSQ